ncbi:MAG TPA: autotransporter-associated beta strand repeat-containing protein [Opitutaceae bacterium]|jgi:autotransporter-associated beta strand protein
MAGAALLLGLAADTARGQAIVWNGGGTNANWSTAGNWNSGAPSTTVGSTQALDFTGSTQTSNTMNNSYSVGSLTFDTGAGAFVVAFGGKILTLDGSAPEILSQSASLETLSSGTVAFSSASTIDVTGSGGLAFTSKLSGGSLVTKTGSGTLSLSGNASAFTGGFDVAGGILSVSTANTVLGTGTVTVASGASLVLTDGRNLATNLNLQGTGAGGIGAVESTGTGTATLSGAVTLSGDTTLDVTTSGSTLKMTGTAITGSGANLTFSGPGSFNISAPIETGSGGVTLNGSGTVTFSGANTYTGLTSVGSGALDLGGTSATIGGNLLINGTGTVLDKASGNLSSGTNLEVDDSGTFNLSGKSETVASLQGSSLGLATLALGGGTLTDTQSSTTAFDGAITGTGTLAFTGTGTLDVQGANTPFTGKVTVSSGVVNGSAMDAFGTGGTATASGTGAFQLQGGNTFDNKFSVASTGGTNSTGGIENVSGANTVTGTVTLTGDSRIQSDAGSLTLSGTVGIAGNSLSVGGAGDTAISGAVSGVAGSTLTKDGAGTLSLGGVSTAYAGTVALNAGTLAFTTSSIFKNNTVGVTFSSGTTLSLNGTTQSLSTLGGGGILSFGSGGSLTLGGIETLSGSMTGSGTLTLGSGATLTLGANFNDPNLNIVLAGGTLLLNGTTDTFGNLSITSNSVLDFKSPTPLSTQSILTVSGVSLSGTSQLSVTNWANMVNYFYSLASPGTQGSAPIDQIIFHGFTGANTMWNTNTSGPENENEITPVPEPRLYGALMGAFGIAAVLVVRGRRARPGIPAGRR